MQNHNKENAPKHLNESTDLVKVPGTGKTINLQGLFNLIKNGFPFEVDKIDYLAGNIDFIIRFVTEHINEDTDMEDLKSVFFVLYRLRDVFENMEVK